MPSNPVWSPHPTQDGSFTFFSDEFGETFHSTQGAKAEAFDKFAQATELAQIATRNQLCLLDVCYGLGYNTAAALETIWAIHPACTIDLYALELDASVPLAAIEPPLITVWTSEVQSILKQIALTHHCTTPRLRANLLIGDARQTVQQLHSSSVQADAIFFDPFSPRRCPQLWTIEFFAQIAQCLSPSGKLATYSRSASVRAALRAARLQIGSIPVGETHEPHEWSQGTIAAFDGQTLPPLSLMEQEHLQTRAAIPYRDPTLSDSPATILERQQREQQQSQRESTSSWRRRWHIK
jgi:tRNA U34 5-methylaminomethyl-2-thiouridine-forming methyltransferase MnmC